MYLLKRDGDRARRAFQQDPTSFVLGGRRVAVLPKHLDFGSQQTSPGVIALVCPDDRGQRPCLGQSGEFFAHRPGVYSSSGCHRRLIRRNRATQCPYVLLLLLVLVRPNRHGVGTGVAQPIRIAKEVDCDEGIETLM